MPWIFWLFVALGIYAVEAFSGVYSIILSRINIFYYSTKYLLTFQDLPPRYTGSNKISVSSSSKKKCFPDGKRKLRIVFVRHGQSMWNSVFNSFGLGWPKRFLSALLMETLCFFFKPFDSALIDSPLSRKGRKEVQELSSFLGKSNPFPFLIDSSRSVIVSSNLRRAMETALVGLAPRIDETKERIVVDSSLQEGSSNIDAQSFSTQSNKIAPMTLGSITNPRKLCLSFFPYLNDGNKKIGENVYTRMDRFVQHLFDGANSTCLKPVREGYENIDLEEVIVVGHSGYFRNFFRRFLPEDSRHIAKIKKMENCAVVEFTLEYDVKSETLSIDESTIKALYKSFK